MGTRFKGLRITKKAVKRSDEIVEEFDADLSKVETEKRPNSLDSLVMIALGRMWSFWKPRNEVKKRCRVKVKVGNYKNGNDKTEYKFRCEKCSEIVDKIDVDHISPVIDPPVGFVTLDEWVKRKFITEEFLQGLCKKCHSIKTLEENKIRVITRKEKKEKSGGAIKKPKPK